jgi:hypothetical protein
MLLGPLPPGYVSTSTTFMLLVRNPHRAGNISRHGRNYLRGIDVRSAV